MKSVDASSLPLSLNYTVKRLFVHLVGVDEVRQLNRSVGGGREAGLQD